MDLFLSWSTPRSQKLASIFDNWIQNIFPTIDIYLSTREITPGERWRDSVGKGLEETSFGIFFLVEENIDSPWINFEAGAISKYIADSNVVPLLHEIKPEQLPGPLAQFQAMSIDEDGLRNIVFSVNRSLNDIRRIDENKLGTIFDKWYPEFEESYAKFSQEKKVENTSKETDLLTVNDQVGQVLNLVRSIDRRLTKLEAGREVLSGISKSDKTKNLSSKEINLVGDHLDYAQISPNATINSLGKISTLQEFESKRNDELLNSVIEKYGNIKVNSLID